MVAVAQVLLYVEGWNGVRFQFYVIRSFNLYGISVQLIHVRN